MSYTNSNWRAAGAPGSAARLAALQALIVEVTDKIEAEVSTHGHSRSANALNDTLRRLEEEERREQASPRAAVNGGVSRIRLGGA